MEQAKQALEDKAEQLALISKYKSEFLANMSHELRTPLNSLLILAKVLAENSEGKLSPKQVKFAETIYSAGTDLLALINDILDLSKIESGMMAVEVEDVLFTDVRDYVLRTFRHVAEGKGLQLNVELDEELPKVMATDNKRLQQVLKNLLSNALKFTEEGNVQLARQARRVRLESGQRGPEQRSRSVLAFEVADTGIGIPEDKQQIIWEAFRQADGTTSRKYGGTGSGLSISREIARLLGGEIHLDEHSGRRKHVHDVPAAGLCADSGRTATSAGARGAARNQNAEERPERGARESRPRPRVGSSSFGRGRVRRKRRRMESAAAFAAKTRRTAGPAGKRYLATTGRQLHPATRSCWSSRTMSDSFRF